MCASLAIGALLFAAGDALSENSGANKLRDAQLSDGSQPSFRGGLVTPPLAKPQFTLIDTSGVPFDFRRETQGYVTLLFFGYTHCPDECPLHMASIAMGLRQIPEVVRDRVKIVFVTTDPARDSPAVIRAWLDHFDPRFVGLTGDAATIDAAQRAARVPATSKILLANKNYQLAHASFVLAYTKDNMAHVIYPGGITARDWIHDLALLVSEDWPIP